MDRLYGFKFFYIGIVEFFCNIYTIKPRAYETPMIKYPFNLKWNDDLILFVLFGNT